MRKTKELLLAGTMIPALMASGLSPSLAASNPGAIVLAQAEPGGPGGAERREPPPGKPGGPAHAPEGQRPAAPPRAAEPQAPRQAPPEAPRPAAPRQQAPEPAEPRPAPKQAPRAEEAPPARQPAPRAAEPQAIPQRAAPKAAAPEAEPQRAAPKAPEPRKVEPEAAPRQAAPKAPAANEAPNPAQPGRAAPAEGRQVPGQPGAAPENAGRAGQKGPGANEAPNAAQPGRAAPAEARPVPGQPGAAPENAGRAGAPNAEAPRPAGVPPAGAPANANAPEGAPARGELRRDAVPGQQGAPGAAPATAQPPAGQPGANRQVPGQANPPAAARPDAAAPAAQQAPVPPPGQPAAGAAQGGARPAAAPPAPPPPPPPPPAAPAARQGAVPQGAAPGQGVPGQQNFGRQDGQRRDRGNGNDNGAIVGAAAGFVGGFLAAQAVQNFNQVRADRQVFTDDGVNIIREPGRTIVEQDDRYYIAHDENERFRDLGYNLDTRQADGYEVTSYVARDGASIYSYTDEQGRLVRRVREYPDGRNVILIDNRYTRYDRNFVDDVVTLPPLPPTELPPPDRYIVDAADAPPALVYDTLTAPPLAPLPRRYTLDQIRYSPDIRARMRSVDLNTITFDTGSWTVSRDQAAKLASIAGAINAAVRQDPKEIYMVEGYTDATGNPADNLSLSDRRAQSVATILTRDFQVPPENLVTQGYGQQYLKVQTQGPSEQNRRVAVRRITPLLSQGGNAQ